MTCFARGNPVPIKSGELKGTIPAFKLGNDDYYVMQGCYHVPANDTLKIESGCVIVFTDWCRIIVNGVIIAGNTDDRRWVEFRSLETNSEFANREIKLEHSTGKSIFRRCNWQDGRAGFNIDFPFEGQNPCSNATFNGSVVYSIASSVQFSACHIEGGVNSISIDSSSHLMITGTSIYKSKRDLYYPEKTGQIAIRNGSTAELNSLQWYESEGALIIDDADTVTINSSNFTNNSDFGLLISGSSIVSIKTCSFLENQCWMNGLMYCDRDSRVEVEFSKFFRNFASATHTLIEVRPGAELSVSQSTFAANLVGEQNAFRPWYGDAFPLLKNYGHFNAYRTIFSDSKPNRLLQTGLPDLNRLRPAVIDGGPNGETIYLEVDLDTVLTQDTAKATFTHCCIHNFAKPHFLVFNYPDYPEDFLKLPVLEIVTTRLIDGDPMFENVALGDLRLRKESPCIGPFDNNALGTVRPTRWIIGCGDDMSPRDMYR